MPRVADSLWCCLCPCFKRSALQRLFIPSISRPPLIFPPLAISTTPVRLLKCYSSNGDTGGDKCEGQNTGFRIDSVGKLQQNEPQATAQRNGQGIPPKPKFLRDVVKELPGTTVGVPQNLQRRSTFDLEDMLQNLMTKSPSMMAATAILRVLIRDRHTRPNVRHYKALILANTDGKHGSPDNIRKLLKEMEDNGIPADAGALHAVLQVGRHYYPSPTVPRPTLPI
jgi:hypothetical protein